MPNSKMIALGENRSVIRDLFEYGLMRKKEVGEENVFDFSIGNPSIPAPQKVDETLISLLQTEESTALHSYSSAPGDMRVRTVIAENINKRFGRNQTPGDIYMTCGAAASLTISLNALLEEGEEVIVFAPFFPEYKVFIEKAGGKVVAVGAREEDFGPDLEGLKAALNEKTRAVIINSPNNPSGAVISHEDMTKLTAILKQAQEAFGKDIFIIADEPYRELVYGDIEVPYIMNYYENTLVCYSYSKSLSLPGERIGYIAVCHEMADRDKVFAAVCGAGRALGFVCAPVLFQKLLLTCHDCVADVSAYAANRELLYNGLTELGYDCVHPDGAFYLFIKAPGKDDGAFCELAKKYNLLLVPSASFGLPGYMRVAYCVSKDTITRSMPAFAALAKECGLKQ
ncbi:MAG: pyridoxal phosphate-dependent aminotransferase [Clostridia bacterium]|nr:pyridoxal phosphate-dependent aminotransferase [Clostridia bacterium]